MLLPSFTIQPPPPEDPDEDRLYETERDAGRKAGTQNGSLVGNGQPSVERREGDDG